MGNPDVKKKVYKTRGLSVGDNDRWVEGERKKRVGGDECDQSVSCTCMKTE
jgi:hypothetical protein